jgi:uncharacterized Ntn-hydrolase superfamily protein
MLKLGIRNSKLTIVTALIVALVGLSTTVDTEDAEARTYDSFLRVLDVLCGGGVCPADEPLWDTGTFSILGYDPATGEVGGAVQSRVFSAGNGVLWAEANVGIVATQAIVDVSYGPQALALLRAGAKPDAIIKQVWDKDPDPLPERWSKQGRQFAVMNTKGEYAAFTGPKATEWAGHKGGKYATAQGNILAGPQVVNNMIEAFENTTGHLSQRLVAALEGGQRGGGDTRGQQSAALVIVKKDCGVWLNNDTILRLQVDDNPEPIKELRRIVDRWNERRPRAVTPACKY